MYVQWDIRYIQGLQRGVTAGEQPAPHSGGAGSRSGAGLRRCCCMQAYIKPSTDERGTDAELCVSSPHFTRHRRKFVQTFYFVQISWHCLHNIAGAVSDHSSHRESRCTGVVSLR